MICGILSDLNPLRVSVTKDSFTAFILISLLRRKSYPASEYIAFFFIGPLNSHPSLLTKKKKKKKKNPFSHKCTPAYNVAAICCSLLSLSSSSSAAAAQKTGNKKGNTRMTTEEIGSAVYLEFY